MRTSRLNLRMPWCCRLRGLYTGVAPVIQACNCARESSSAGRLSLGLLATKSAAPRSQSYYQLRSGGTVEHSHPKSQSTILGGLAPLAIVLKTKYVRRYHLHWYICGAGGIVDCLTLAISPLILCASLTPWLMMGRKRMETGWRRTPRSALQVQARYDVNPTSGWG